MPPPDSGDPDPVSALQDEIRERFGLLPAFFECAESVDTLGRLWEQTRIAYIENPIPPLFKEELFTYLSRFCAIPYCLARHAAFLQASVPGSPSGDVDPPPRSPEDVLDLIRRPIPSTDEMEAHLAFLAKIAKPIDSWPDDIRSALGEALFACSIHAFLADRMANRCLGELRRVLGSEKLERLIAFLGFVRVAHDWTRAHPEIEFESDLKELLAAQPELRAWLDRYESLVASEARIEADSSFRRLTTQHETLKRSMEALGSALDESTNEIFIIDAETLRFIHVNQGLLRNLGYSIEELRERTPLDLEPELSPEFYSDLIAPLVRGEKSQIEFSTSHRRKDGSRYPVDVHLQATVFENRPAYLATILDLSERRAQERRVRESEARASAILNTAPDSILTINATGTIEGVNAAALRTFGYSEEAEIVGRNVRMLMPREHAAAHDDHLRRYLETGEARIIGLGRDLEGRKKDGTVFPIRLSVGETTLEGERHFTGVIHDLTREKQIEIERDEGAHRLRALFNQRMSMTALCRLDGRLIDANRAALAYIGAEREDVVDCPFWETRWWTHDPALQVEIERGLERAAQGESVRFDATHRRVDGRLGTFDFSITPVRDANAQVETLLVESVDITDKRSLQEQLVQSQKMEAIGMLAGGIAHDFNNLLTSIRGSDEILLDHLDPEGRPARSARRIMLAVDRATALTTKLLGLSRQKISQRGPVDANRIVEETRDLFLRTLPEDIELKVDLSNDPLYVRADDGQIAQVLMNLSLNACDAMPTGGSLQLTTERRRLEGAEADSLGIAPGEFVAVRVRDHGEGIPPETLAKIFDPFFTTKAVGKGTGLGLAISTVIVREHGGAIDVESSIGQGTTFTVFLPEIEAPLSRSASGGEATLGASPERLGQKTSPHEMMSPQQVILVVEDDDVMRELVVEVLEGDGYRVMAAASPAEAIELADGPESRFDLLVSDVVMPGMTGFDLASELRSGHPNLRILHMSGYSDQMLADRGELEIDDPFIRKPFGNDDLLTKVREVLEA